MSSGTYQKETRIWAKKLPRAVIAVIDYRLAPGARYPNQIDDVWQAYFWLVYNCKGYLGFDPKHILFGGDSAGGNLSLACTVMSIQREFRRPDGHILIYPAVCCSNQEFWPSLLMSLDDYILPTQFLNLSVCSYAPKGMLYNKDVQHCEYLSPALYASDDVVRQFPRTILIVGTCDPFKDDIYRLMDRMLQVGMSDVVIKEFRMLSHGFMSQNPEGPGLVELVE